MGDAGPPTPQTAQEISEGVPALGPSSTRVRDVHILVTGFGAFKSFHINPSFLIASALPSTLSPAAHKPPTSPTTSEPLRPPNTTPYTIHVHTHPSPVRVAYSTTATLIPNLLTTSPAPYDYVLHIGLAAGRSTYTLETRAHRDHYKLKDVDDRDGFISGEYMWKREGVPNVLSIGWDAEEVLRRWDSIVAEKEGKDTRNQNSPTSRILHDDGHMREGKFEKVGTGDGDDASRQASTETQADVQGKTQLTDQKSKAIVKLSRDAGRFLCEFIFFTSLAVRWKEARDEEKTNQTDRSGSDEHEHTISVDEQARIAAMEAAEYNRFQIAGKEADSAAEKLGKVAFLHVPGGTEPRDIERGLKVAEAAILAVIGSWEDGYRNKDLYGKI